MKDLKSTKALVKSILEADEKARNSDSYLYLKVIKHIAVNYGIDLHQITIIDFLLNLVGSVFPPFESVRRARQKLQEKFPHLAADPVIELFRAENEEVYREFARE